MRLVTSSLQRVPLHFKVASMCLESFLDIAKITVAIQLHFINLELSVALILHGSPRHHRTKVRWSLVDARLRHLIFLSHLVFIVYWHYGI